MYLGVCSNVIYILAGWDEAQVNTTLLETIFQHTPAGTSTNTLIQFGQEINSSKLFCNQTIRTDWLNLNGQRDIQTGSAVVLS